MIWTLKIKVCGMQPECSRLIEIDSGASFLALHDAIQEAVDFGDNWLFQITKTRRRDKTPEQGVKYPCVVEAKGENPEQYPDWDEDDEDY